MNKITSITIDMKFNHYSTTLYYNEPVITVQRGGYWDGTTTTYKATPCALLWAQRYIARNEGAFKVNNPNSATWFHNVDSMYTDGYIFESDFVTLKVLPNWNLKIILNDDGREYITDTLIFSDADVKRYYHGMDWDKTSEEDKEIARAGYRSGQIMHNLEYELLEDALYNGLTLDPNDNGSMFMAFDAGIDDDGDFDVTPGDLGWSDGNYAIRSYVEALLDNDYVLFNPYYFGETSLEDQHAI